MSLSFRCGVPDSVHNYKSYGRTYSLIPSNTLFVLQVTIAAMEDWERGLVELPCMIVITILVMHKANHITTIVDKGLT